MKRLSREALAAAEAVRQQRATLDRLEAELDDLRRQARERREALIEKRGDLGATLTALLRLGRRPPEALIAMPGTPIDVVHTAVLMGATLPALSKEANGLRDDIAALAAQQRDIDQQRERIARSRTMLEGERQRLDAVIREKRALGREIAAAERDRAQRAQTLARKAKTLHELLAALEADRLRRERGASIPPAKPSPPVPPTPKAKPVQRPAQQAHGQRTAMLNVPRAGQVTGGEVLALPVVGRVIAHYGERDGATTRRGITLHATPGAPVLAPFSGEVVFSGPFRGYGLLLIIQHGEGYHTLLAGLGRLDVGVGQSVLAGEPVGVMKGSNASGKRTASDRTTGEGDPAEADVNLYVEIRRNGDPVNPVPLLRTEERKVKG